MRSTIGTTLVVPADAAPTGWADSTSASAASPAAWDCWGRTVTVRLWPRSSLNAAGSTLPPLPLR